MIRVLPFLLLLALASAPAAAQPAPDGRFDLSFNAGVLAGAGLGEQAAAERGSSGDPFRLFQSDTSLGSSGAFDVRLGVAVTPRLALEGRAAFGRATLTTSVSNDFEGAPAAEISERISQYAFDGGVRIHFDAVRFAGFVPLATGGIGYLRQLHASRALVDERAVYYVGGGVMRALFAGARGFIRGGGVRGDVRLQIVGSSDALGEDDRRQALASGGVFVVF